MRGHSNSQIDFQRSQRTSTKVKGDHFEQQASKVFHLQGIPILVYSHLLKKRGLGQLDLCLLNFKSSKITAAECKNHQLPLGKVQKARVKSSLEFLEKIFDKQGEFKVIRPFAKSCETA